MSIKSKWLGSIIAGLFLLLGTGYFCSRQGNLTREWENIDVARIRSIRFSDSSTDFLLKREAGRWHIQIPAQNLDLEADEYRLQLFFDFISRLQIQEIANDSMRNVLEQEPKLHLHLQTTSWLPWSSLDWKYGFAPSSRDLYFFHRSSAYRMKSGIPAESVFQLLSLPPRAWQSRLICDYDYFEIRSVAVTYQADSTQNFRLQKHQDSFLFQSSDGKVPALQEIQHYLSNFKSLFYEEKITAPDLTRNWQPDEMLYRIQICAMNGDSIEMQVYPKRKGEETDPFQAQALLKKKAVEQLQWQFDTVSIPYLNIDKICRSFSSAPGGI